MIKINEISSLHSLHIKRGHENVERIPKANTRKSLFLILWSNQQPTDRRCGKDCVYLLDLVLIDKLFLSPLGKEKKPATMVFMKKWVDGVEEVVVSPGCMTDCETRYGHCA